MRILQLLTPVSKPTPLLISPLLLILILRSPPTSASSPLTSLFDLTTSITNLTRRNLNFSNLFTSPTYRPPAERLTGQPVFSVTTSWGSPYLLFEPVSSSESSLEFDESAGGANDRDTDEKEEDEAVKFGQDRPSAVRQVGLYFMDEEDALRLRDEMLQMEHMADADMRITVSSLSKALVQSLNLNNGLVTGQPIVEHTGKLKSPSEGGMLRYKIVPPKRELFYAARCEGREKVGLWADDPEDDADLMMASIPVIGAFLGAKKKSVLDRRKKEEKRRERGQIVEEEKDPIRREYKHMEGEIGIPVFHCEELKMYSKVKQGILRNDKTPQTPLYLSYDDLMDSWNAARDRLQKKQSKSKAGNNIVMPEKPKVVEVHNLMDVVTSMDRKRWMGNRASQVRRSRLLGKIPLLNKVVGTTNPAIEVSNNGLERIIFVPSSKSARYKERTSRTGNSKAQGLKPMKKWGRDAM